MELPAIARPAAKMYPEVGPSVQYPVNGLPWRNANTASPPGAGGSRQDPAKGMELWRGASPPYREMGVDARWHHSIIVVDREGKVRFDSIGTQQWQIPSDKAVLDVVRSLSA